MLTTTPGINKTHYVTDHMSKEASPEDVKKLIL
jgi:hypothetical protein